MEICSTLKRAHERILENRVKDYASFGKAQKGFTQVPETYQNPNILYPILKNAKQEKEECFIMFMDN